MKAFLSILLIGLLILGNLTGCGRANFEIVSLTVEPSEVVSGKVFTVEAEVKNMGGSDGSFTGILMLDENTVEEKSIIISAGAEETITFSCVVTTPGTHTLKLNDQTTTFTTLKPATFTVVSVSIPPEVTVGEAATIEVDVANTGEVSGIYNACLTVNEERSVETDVMIAPGVTETITFVVTEKTSGTYKVRIGELTGLLEVTQIVNFPDFQLETAIRKAINKPEGLSHDALKLFEDRALLISPVVDLSALYFAVNNTGIGQVSQLTLHRAPPGIHGIQYLFGVERAIRPPVEKCKHRLPGLAEKPFA